MNIIIDYGLGNITSVDRALKRLGHNTKITSDPDDLLKATTVILPGVGAFGKAVNNLKRAGIYYPLKEYLKEGKPYLGICLGLQILFSFSSEHGYNKGLGIIEGRVERFANSVKVPHMGWNNVIFRGRSNAMFDGVKDGTFFYFDHSYYVIPDTKVLVASETEYGKSFVSSVCFGNIWGVQFHPEKSADAGLRILDNFISMGVENAR